MNKKAVIVGKSELVGIPCYSLLEKMGCHCQHIDKTTSNPTIIAKKADILVSAVGQPGLITSEWIKPNATLIDIGTTCVKNEYGKYVLTGDVAFDQCIGHAGNITPVPGGVALLTTAMLMFNTLKAMVMQEDLFVPYNKMTDFPLTVASYPNH